MARSSFVLVLLAFVAVAHATATSAEMDLAVKTAEELGSQSGLVEHINAVAADMRLQHERTGAKGYLCKTVFLTNAMEFPYSERFLNKYGDWVPTTQKSLSIFLQGEASAKAFVGIGAGIGMGIDMTVDITPTPKKATGQIRLFACLGASLSIGYIGTNAAAGGGVLVGFGRFKDSIVASNLEVSVDVSALGSGGVGVLLDVVGGAKAFKKAWLAHQQTAIGKPQRTCVSSKEWALRAFAFMKQCAKDGVKIAAATVRGVHISGGVGVGAGIGFSTELDGEAVIGGIRDGFKKIWASKAGSWVKSTKAWAGLQKQLKKVGASKFGQKWASIKGSIGRFIKKSVDKTNDFFDYVPLTEEEGNEAAAAAADAPARPSTSAPAHPPADAPAPARPSTPAPTSSPALKPTPKRR